MDFENLFTENTTIKISIVKIDNKKLNKSIFNQMEIISPFENNLDFKKNIKFLGFVFDKEYWMIFTFNLKIYRFELKSISLFIKLDLETISIRELSSNNYNSEKVNNLFVSDKFKAERGMSIKKGLGLEEYNIILNRKKILMSFMDKLRNHQIFI